MVYADASIYTGYWKNDLRHGNGKYVCTDFTYVGRYIEFIYLLHLGGSMTEEKEKERSFAKLRIKYPKKIWKKRISIPDMMVNK